MSFFVSGGLRLFRVEALRGSGSGVPFRLQSFGGWLLQASGWRGVLVGRMPINFPKP